MANVNHKEPTVEEMLANGDLTEKDIAMFKKIQEESKKEVEAIINKCSSSEIDFLSEKYHLMSKMLTKYLISKSTCISDVGDGKDVTSIPQELGEDILVNFTGLGGIKLNSCDITEYFLDKNAFMAKSYGVSKECFLAWIDCRRSGGYQQCIGKVKSGRQCKAHAAESHSVDHPNLYTKCNPDLYCHNHKWQAG